MWFKANRLILLHSTVDKANGQEHPPLVAHFEFYNSTLDHIDLMAEFYAWQSPRGHDTVYVRSSILPQYIWRVSS